MASVTIDKTDLLSVEQKLSILRTGAKDAIIYATNDAMAGVKTEAARLVGEKITPKISVIKEHFIVNKMKKSDMTADLTCSGKPLPLINYSARSVVKGVSVQVFKKGIRTVIRHAFIATMKSTHKGVFWRETRLGGTKWKVGKRMVLPSPSTFSKLRQFQLPITERYGPRISDIFDDSDIINPTLANASIRFDDRLEYHTERLLDKARQA